MKKLSTEEFIERAREIHGDRYDYSNTVCTGSKNNVEIYCKKHKCTFTQQAGSHLRGCGCPLCGKEPRRKLRTSVKSFIKKSREIHGNDYDYSEVDYKGVEKKVCIKCNKCGQKFWQSPSKHLSGRGCPNCKLSFLSSKFRKPRSEFIEQANKVHGYGYDYSKVTFNSLHDKITIICPEHGEFIQEAQSHLQGCRCPKCSRSSHLEDDVRLLLSRNSIQFEEQKTWEWLIYKSNQYVDFFLPDYNTVIECQGIQHFESVKFFGAENLEEVKLRDTNKLELCTKNGIRMLYYSNLGENYSYPYEVITSLDNLIQKIKELD